MSARGLTAPVRGMRGSSQGLAMLFLLFLVASAGVAWVYSGMTAREQWPVRWLEVNGTFQRVSAEQLRSTLAPVAHGSFFTVDLKAVRDAAYRQPWVAQATIQKTWPDTVEVYVREYSPAAHWIDGQLVSDDGRAFKVPAADEIQGLPWLSGPADQLQIVFETWKEFNNELLPTGQEIERIQLDPRGAWSIELSSGSRVRLGRDDALPRLQRMVRSWPELMRGRELTPASIDLRYTNGFAVRWPKSPAQFAGNHGQEN